MATKKPKATAEPLAKKLDRIDALLAAARPAAAKAMKAGASDAAIKRLAKAIGVASLPDDVATFFRWHDGQATPASLREGDNRTPMSVADAIEAWTFLSDPSEDVLQPWKKTWLPLFENGAGDHLCFDLGKGSLVAYWHADEDRVVEHPGLAAWADDVLAALAKEAAKPKKAEPAAPRVKLDAGGASWRKLGKAPTEKLVGARPTGTVLWYKKRLVDDQEPLMYLFVRVEDAGEKPWRKIPGDDPDLEGSFGQIQGFFDRDKPPPDDWWKADDWDVAYACKEDAFGDEPVDLFEGTIRVLRR